MSDKRTQLLADELFSRLKKTSEGHCARVDFLEREDALLICQHLTLQLQHTAPDLLVRVLASRDQEITNSNLFITTDKAVELRNRKQGRLCLFVPSDLVDAAYSSLANSFALISGQVLFEAALKKLVKKLPPDAQKVVSFAGQGALKASYEQRLDFAVTASMQPDQGLLGLELWRVGLIADARPDFVPHLTSNRNNTILLSRPTRPDATVRERVKSLKVDQETTNALVRFFHNRSMNDVVSWSHALAQEQILTFDRWVFPASDHSDMKSVTILPFLNAHGVVEKFCRLTQPDNAQGNLQAICGPKRTMVVKWTCNPPKPQNLSGWSVRIVPADFDDELVEDSDFIEPKIPRVPASRSMVTIKLDLEDDEMPTGPVCVRIAPLDATGNELVDKSTDKPIFDKSTEFFLTRNPEADIPGNVRENRVLVPTLSYGRLEAALKQSEGQILAEEQIQAQWLSKDLFSLTFPNKTVLNVAVSETLIALERLVRDNPRSGGCFTLSLDEVVPVSVETIQPYLIQYSNDTTWSAFWKAREAFFNRLKKSSTRDTLETADWSSELLNAGLRYVQEYQKLLNALVENGCEHTEILEALSIDSLLVQLTTKGDKLEEALVILPTHPLRIAWLMSYTQLLKQWEERLLTHPKNKRAHIIDCDTLRMLTPTNVPAFTYHAASKNAFLFFQNIMFYHGVALPPNTPDPRRHFINVAHILRGDFEQSTIGDIQPQHLKEHLERFFASHSYTHTLVTTLVNPDRGDFFTKAVQLFLEELSHSDDVEDACSPPSFQIAAYTQDEHVHSLSTVTQTLQHHHPHNAQVTDYFLPRFSATVHSINKLTRKAPEAHVAVVMDLTQPTIIVGPQPPTNGELRTEISSFSLYGLINRFIPQFTVDEQGLRWNYRIIPEGIKKPEPHPSSPRFSESLLELHQSLLTAQGYLSNKQNKVYPMLEVRIEPDRGKLLEHLHTNTNWVITLDRFFALDYYDSPNTPELCAQAKKYVLDYSPETLEGFGHRMMVTTAWHEEIESLLAQTMAEFGFNSIDESVGQLLHYLKTISGRLALQALDSSTKAAAAVGLGVVTFWLEKQGKLKDAILVPVDIYPRIFSLNGTGKPQQGERRCDMVLISLRRDIVDATFIEVKWRRGQAPLQELANDMVLQMENSAKSMRKRFFDDQRVDGTLQRSYLANVFKFYFDRSKRYGLINPHNEKPFLERLARLEKTGLEFRPTYEGFIVNLEGQSRKPIEVDIQATKAKITVLTARDFHNVNSSEISSLLHPSISLEDDRVPSTPVEDSPWRDNEIAQEFPSHTIAPLTPTINDTESAYPAMDFSSQADTPPEKEVVVPLGHSASQPVEWKPATKGSPHLFIIGIPGQGKSWTTTRILNELGKQHVPTMVLDFHGQFADPLGPFMHTVHPSVVDAAKGLPFSPFECTGGNGFSSWKANSYALAEIFANVTGLGPMQRDIIYTALQEAYKAHGFTLDDEEQTLDLDYPDPEEILRRIERKEQERRVNNVSARCRPLLEMNLFQPLKNVPDMLTAIRRGLIIDLHNLYAEELQIAAGAFVLHKLYRDMFHWGATDHLRLAIVLDEAHRLARDVTLPKIMKEGRKFGIAVIVASQGMNDFHQDILSNAGTKVIFRVNYPDSKKVAGFIRGRSTQDLVEHIEQLQVGTAYIQTPEMPYGSLVHMYPLEE